MTAELIGADSKCHGGATVAVASAEFVRKGLWMPALLCLPLRLTPAADVCCCVGAVNASLPCPQPCYTEWSAGEVPSHSFPHPLPLSEGTGQQGSVI